MNPINALQKKLMKRINKMNMTNEELKLFCYPFLGEDTDVFLFQSDYIDKQDWSYAKKQKQMTTLWVTYLGDRVRDLKTLKEMHKKLKELGKKRKKK